MGRNKYAYPDLPARMTARKVASGTMYYYQWKGRKIPLGIDLEAAKQSADRISRGLCSPLEAFHGGLATMTESEIAARATPLQRQAGVYFLIKAGKIVYVGKSLDVWRRLKDHAERKKGFDAFCWQPCSPQKLDELEGLCIAKFRPPLNLNGRRI